MVCLKEKCVWAKNGVCSRQCRFAVDEKKARLRRIPDSPCHACPSDRQFRCNGAMCKEYRAWATDALVAVREALT